MFIFYSFIHRTYPEDSSLPSIPNYMASTSPVNGVIGGVGISLTLLMVGGGPLFI